MNTLLTVTKVTVGLITGAGVNIIAKEAIRKSTPDNLNKAGKVMVAFGSLALSAIAAKKATEYTDQLVDEVGSLVGTVKGTKKSEVK